MSVTLVLCRHAESTLNVSAVVNGDPRAPSPLTRRGREQAVSLGRRLRKLRVGLCVTSEFERARATARIAVGERVPTLILGELNDPRLGSFEGAPLGTYLEWLRAHDSRARPPGGESQIDAVARYCAAFELLIGRPEDVIAVVCHSLPVGVALNLVADGEPALKPEYATVEPARPHMIDAGALHDGVRRARREMASR
jgi:broad specificity phosphatase PhoE